MQVTCAGCGKQQEWKDGVPRTIACRECGHFMLFIDPPEVIQCVACGKGAVFNDAEMHFNHCRQKVGIPLPPKRAKVVVKEALREKVKATKSQRTVSPLGKSSKEE